MKNRTLISLSLSLFFVLPLFTSCDKGDDPPAESIKDPIVHLAGSSSEGGGNYRVTYWKNGIKTFLQPAEKNGSPYSILVNDGNVYIGGVDGTNNNGIVWKNATVLKEIDEIKPIDRVLVNFSGSDLHLFYSVGDQFVHEKNNINQGTINGYIIGSFVNGIDAFACGYKTDPNNYAYAVYWKNGVETQLTQPVASEYSLATSITTVNNDNYISGFTDYSNVSLATDAVYWKNGSKTVLPSDGDARAYKVFISGNDVYVAGYSSEKVGGVAHATYWKNGEKFVLDNSSTTESYLFNIAVTKSGKVYALGSKGFASLWIDGKLDEEINGTKEDYINYMFLEEN